jgi:branched-chain amino acid aminotransferase
LTLEATPSLPFTLVNGEAVAADGFSISAGDRGFTLADGLFETMRVQNGVVFRLDRHLARLHGGLRTLGIPPQPAIGAAIGTAMAQSGARDASMRVTVTRGPGAGGLTPPADVQPTVVITVSAMPAFPPGLYERGISAIIPRGRRNSQSMTAGVKTLSYTDAVVAWLEARQAGAEEAIFLDSEGYCAEATASNLFIWSGGVMMTPRESGAVLPGITRAAVMELSQSLGFTMQPDRFTKDRLLGAGEAFLTSSLRGVVPVTRVDGQPIGSGTPGPVTKRVIDAYRALVDRECTASPNATAPGAGA